MNEEKAGNVAVCEATGIADSATNAAAQRYEANWESLSRYEIPAWFRDDKFGIFIHWGPYAVPAFGSEWYPNLMYMHPVEKASEFACSHWDVPSFYEHHVKTYGPLDKFGYKDFIPMFKGERFDPDAWVGLFKECGAKYVVPVGEHHDGFAMYASELTEWTAAQMGPKRDVVKDLEIATRAAGLKFGVSSHRANNWKYYVIDEAFDNSEPAFEGLYGPKRPQGEPESEAFVADWYARTLEIIERFHPDLLWFDIGWHREPFAAHRPRVAADYYNDALEHGYEPVLNYKKCFPDGTAVFDIERGKLDGMREEAWQTDTSVSYNSWCHIANQHYRTPTSLIHDLVDIVSKNGNLLLNVGPRADGVIPDEQQAILRSMGAWLKVNGEAIYGSRPWKVFGEGPTGTPTGQLQEQSQGAYTERDIRFTQRGDALYVFVLVPSEDGVVRIESLGRDSGHLDSSIESVALLDTGEALPWVQEASALSVRLPASLAGEHAWVLKIRGQESGVGDQGGVDRRGSAATGGAG